MRFIDKAMEKAMSMQQKKASAAAAPEPAKPEPWPGLPAGSPAARGPVLWREEISYTITRTVPVDPELLRQQRIITGRENDLVAEEYKLLRTQILQRTKADNRTTLMVTGPFPGEGKTLTAINLAISISQDLDTTVLLVDADLRQPAVHRYFGLPKGPGLVDHLVSGVPIPDLLVHPQGFSKLVILPGGKPRAEAAELISSPMMAGLVQELKEFYANRYVIFDLPPVMSYVDAIAFAPFVDGIILVVERGRTSRESVQECLQRLKGMPLLGCVLNKVSMPGPGHYYSSYYPEAERPKGSGWLKSWFS